jgi:hypothetical protein
LDFNGKHFVLKNKLTACLASDACGIPIDLPAKQVEKQKIKLSDLGGTSCKPGSGCC